MRGLFRRALMVGAMVGLGVAIFAGQAAASTLTYPSGTGACALSTGDATNSGLGKCIASAHDGDTINIKAGHYSEADIPVSHRVSIHGPCSGVAAVFDVLAGADGPGNGLVIGTNGVGISCLTFRHASGTLAIDGAAIDNNPSGIPPYNGLTVTQVTVTSSGGGIILGSTGGGGTGLSVKNSTFLSVDYGVEYAPSTGAGANGAIFSGNKCNSVMYCDSLVGDNMTIASNSVNKAFFGVLAIGNGNTVTKNTVYNSGYGAYLESDMSFHSGAAMPGPASMPGNPLDAPPPPLPARRAPRIARALGTALGARPARRGTSGVSTTNTVSSNKIAYADIGVAYSGERSGDVAFVMSGNTLNFIGSAAAGLTGTDITVTGNKIVYGAGYTEGIVTDSGDGPVVTKNSLVGVGLLGIGVTCETSCSGLQVSQNTLSGTIHANLTATAIHITAATCGSAPCGTVTGNSVNDCLGWAYVLEMSFATISGNKASNDGFSQPDSGAFSIVGDGNTVTTNTGINSVTGFDLAGSNNTLRSNTATGNSWYGIRVVSGDGNTIDANITKNNNADGINNDGTTTNLTNNKSSGNRQDCTSDTSEGASTGTVGSNTCGDGHAFDWESSAIDGDDADDS